jgi:enamidase
MEAVVDEAQNHNLWVAAHTSSAEEMRHVLATGGVRTIEHGAHQDTLSAETIEQMNAQDVILVPTLAVLDARTESADSSRAPLHTSMYNVRRAHEAGVSIGAGTDTQGPTMHFGRSLHRELELLVEAGLSPRDALRGATSKAARALRSDDLGRIAPGARSDVLIVAGRPWRDIRDARNVRIVLKDGRVLVSEDET